jgi:hypothetical protein
MSKICIYFYICGKLWRFLSRINLFKSSLKEFFFDKKEFFFDLKVFFLDLNVRMVATIAVLW